MSGSERPSFGSNETVNGKEKFPGSVTDSGKSMPILQVPGYYYLDPETGGFRREILEKERQISQGKY